MATDTKYVRGAQRLSARLEGAKRLLAFGVFQEELKKLLLRRTLKRFDEQRDPDGRPWVPLKSSTLKSRGSGTNGKILNRTGAMRGAIRVIRGRADGILATSSGLGFRIGVDDTAQTVKARVHQFGYRHIPQRRFLGIGRLDVQSVDSFLKRRAESI